MRLDRLDWRWLDVRFLDSSVRAWIAAVGVAAASYLAFLLIRRLIVRRVGKLAARTASGLDDLVVELAQRTRRWLLLLTVIYFGSLFLNLPRRLDATLHTAAVLAVLIQLALWALSGIDFWVARTRRQRLAEDAASVTLIALLGFIAKTVMAAVVLLLMLDNLGVNVTALVAGLGVGGIAVALALQNILGDIFAALSIVLDKPFVVGDPIAVDDVSGSVEHIGLKSTRLRSITGELVIISNGDLLKSRIRNFRGQEKRLVTLKLGIAYGTPPDKLARVPEIVRDAVRTEAQVRLDRTHFSTFGTYALVVDTVYAMDQSSYAVYMDTQQRINLEIYRRLSAEAIELAHPMLPAPTDVK